MSAEVHRGKPGRLQILVAISSYGVKNAGHLRRIIQEYQRMRFDVDIVVFSEAPKDLGPGVDVVVGLPSRNPWTLPFAHKAAFARHADDYDLFIYSEDDIHAREPHIDAFLDATGCLRQDEIAGFVRYELDASGRWFVNEPWKHYHWKPESVRRRGKYTVAEFTNEHTGFYILSQDQLKRAIASGGFVRSPYRARYDWPETAATDPYTSCGFRKVICVSHIDEFLVHHLPNPYVHRLDVTLDAFKEQIETLENIAQGKHPVCTLCAVESSQWPRAWQKSYYERPSTELLELISKDARNLLSVGCGWGAFEAEVIKRGVRVTAFPLDSVIGTVAGRQGVEMIYGSMDNCFNALEGRTFDCVVVSNLLHLLDDPNRVLAQCVRAVKAGGALVIGGPNFDRWPWRLKRCMGIDGFDKLRSYEQSGFHRLTPALVEERLRPAGFEVRAVCWLNHEISWAPRQAKGMRCGKFTARDWLLRATSHGPAQS